MIKFYFAFIQKCLSAWDHFRTKAKQNLIIVGIGMLGNGTMYN